MALAPRPKAKVRHGLQTGDAPRIESGVQDPNKIISASKYRRAAVGESAGAMPAETYQYDLVYRKFQEDTTFWRQWHVVDCARQSAQASISQDQASIRVVLDLPSTVKLYPTAYTPGFPTMPPGTDISNELPEFKPVPGLPAGHSVALDIYILEDARILLEHQRNHRNGEISKDLEWLDNIITEHDIKHGRPPAHVLRQHERNAGRQLEGRGEELKPEEVARRFAKADDAERMRMQEDPDIARKLQDLETLSYSDLYSSDRTHPHLKIGPGEVWKECALVAPFEGVGDGKFQRGALTGGI